jgi:hypothetical protein
MLSPSTALLVFISLAYASPLTNAFLTHRDKTPTSGDRCRAVADNDLYGNGVRIGMYLQWGAGFVLRNLESWETRSQVRIASNILASAVALATVINVCKGTALSVDYLMSYYLTVVLFYAESYNLEIRVKSTVVINDSIHKTEILALHADLPLVFQNVYFTAFTIFGAWYWLKGIALTTDPVCGGKAALLGVFNIQSRTWTHAAAALAIITAIAFIMVFFLHITSFYDGIGSGAKLVAIEYAKVVEFISGGYRGKDSNTIWEWKTEMKPLLRPAFPGIPSLSAGKALGFLLRFIHYFLINLAGPLIAIVSVERMVAANYLSTAPAFDSAGQIIALFTGMTSAILACWKLFKKGWKLWRTNDNSRPDGMDEATTLQSTAKDEISLPKDMPVEEKPDRPDRALEVREQNVMG